MPVAFLDYKKEETDNKMYIAPISWWSINQIHIFTSEQALDILTQSICKKYFWPEKEQAAQLTVIQDTTH